MREEQEVRSPQECLTAQEKKQEMSGIRSGGRKSCYIETQNGWEA